MIKSCATKYCLKRQERNIREGSQLPFFVFAVELAFLSEIKIIFGDY